MSNDIINKLLLNTKIIRFINSKTNNLKVSFKFITHIVHYEILNE